MPVQVDDTLLHYRIVEKIGEGGMGEVWRATDTTLDRDVAIKVLPAAFAGDAERLARFEREAKLLASFNHPQIAAIHGFHEDGGRRFLSMEFVPGEDLAERLVRGPIPMSESLAYALKIAEALECAHERGIVHRDLKPANVRITPDGEVKVLDFGLAKAIAGDPSMSGPVSTPTVMPTVTSAGTAVGLILGTAAYMSPEQARGKPVDRRADIWAFGCVLYEMLAGRRLFDGETVTDVLAAVVTRDPEWTSLPAATPPSVRRLLARCLDKDPRTRLRDAGEARIALAKPAVEDPIPAPAGSARDRNGRWWIAATAVALIAGVMLGRYALAPGNPPAPVFEFDVTVSESHVETGSFALSPDGLRLALVIRDDSGNRQLAVRDLNRTEARVVPGTKGALYPFWSPDGREIAYFADNQLNRIALDGAAARPVTSVTDPRGGAWGAGNILLIGSGSGPILRVPASGGKSPEPVTEIEKEVEETHAWPALLPDGKRFVFLCDASSDEGHRIRLGSVDGGATRILKQVVRSQPVVDPAGRLLLGERGQLVAYPFDLDSGALGDESTLIATHVYPVGSQHQLPASTSIHGMVAFQNTSSESNLLFVDNAGRVTQVVGGPERFGNPSVSPDGKRVAFEIFGDTQERLVWVQDLERGVRTPVSQRGKMADSSTWSADGETVYFDSSADGGWQIFRKAVTGGGQPESLGSPPASDIAVLDASSDGRWLLAAVVLGENRNDLYLRSLDGAGDEWISWAAGPADEDRGSFSPDSRWIAYTSDASGRVEAYVASLEGGPVTRRWQISSGGGFEPRFSPDGSTIYYRSATSEWMAVDVRFDGEKVEAGASRALFSIPEVEMPWQRNLMDVLPDGSGFVTLHPASTNATGIRVRTGS